MNVAAISEKRFTVKEYIEFDENNGTRHEFYNGILYPIAGTSDTHNEVVFKISMALYSEFNKRGCKVFSENVKLQIVENGKYVYPDVMLTCDERDANSRFIKRFASLVVEVLSKSTAAYDRGLKFNEYQTLACLQYYLLVDSRWQSAELYSRTNDPEVWTYQRFSKPTDIIVFPQLNFKLSLKNIYESVNIPERFSYLVDKDEND